jgi:hypothetical protein
MSWSLFFLVVLSRYGTKMVAYMGHNVRPKDKNFTGASAGCCSWSEGGVQRNSIDSAHVSKHPF